MCVPLELQSTLARRIGQRLDAAMIGASATIKDDLAKAGGFGLVGDRLPDLLGGGDIAAVLQVAAHVILRARGGDQRLAVMIVDDLGVNMLAAAINRKARPLAVSQHLVADAVLAAGEPFGLFNV